MLFLAGWACFSLDFFLEVFFAPSPVACSVNIRVSKTACIRGRAEQPLRVRGGFSRRCC